MPKIKLLLVTEGVSRWFSFSGCSLCSAISFFFPQLSTSEHFPPLGPCLLMPGILTLLQPAPFQCFPNPAFRLSGKGLSDPHVTDHIFIYFGLKHKKSVLQKVLEARSPKSRYWLGHASSRAPKEGLFLVSSSSGSPRPSLTWGV